MEPLLKFPVQEALPHALPFRIMFEEYRRRRETDLLQFTHEVLGGGTENAAEQLRALISHQESLYKQLAQASAEIDAGTRKIPLDGLVGPCQAADSLLKQILHKMEASAVCLSGGGIRCATISLGVLEGLARFSGGAGLMRSLDYLSTVSGGGYMGSWMMSWVYRQMTARGSRCLQDAMACVEDALTEQSGDDPDFDHLVMLADTAHSSIAAWAKEYATLPSAPLSAEQFQSVIEAGDALGRWVTGNKQSFVQKMTSFVQNAVAQMPLMQAKAAAVAVPNAPAPQDPRDPALKAPLIHAQLVFRQALGIVAKAAYGDVLDGLAGHAHRTGGDPEPQPVRHLRSYTSYLAPDLGLTLDTFTLAAIILRNLVVNWAMLVPVLITGIAALELSAAVMMYAHGGAMKWLYTPLWKPTIFHHHVWVTWGGILILLTFLVAALAAGIALPSHETRWSANKKLRLALAMVLIASVTAGAWLLTATARGDARLGVFIVKSGIAWCGYFLLTVFISWTYHERATDHHVTPWRSPGFVLAMGLLAGTTMALANGGLLYALQDQLFGKMLHMGNFATQHGSLPPVVDSPLFVIFALPLTLAAVVLTTTLYCALMGIFEGEDDREWWVRCGGAFTGISLAWMAGHALALYGNAGFVAIISAITGAVLGAGSSLLGFSGTTAATKDPAKTSQLSSVGNFLVKHDLVLPVVGGAAILFLAMAMVWVEEKLRGVLDLWPWFAHHFPQTAESHGVMSTLMMLLVAGLLAVMVNFAININLFSLHGMYRMRLMRAFLGASNVFRQPDPFTRFDMKDTPREAEMACFAGSPVHLLNATLNLTGTKNPAWRQRKGEGFSFSPVACGGWRMGYVPTPLYAGSRGKGYRQRGITLATAMAISGAAANPNMGYQSSPVLSLLMTFFNLRLGCWLPNPARPTPRFPRMGAVGEAFFEKPGPSFALRPLIAEALELTDDTYRWVELTDGGHFEDLALYEMAMRRVKHIVLVDGGADPTFGFEDLGNAVRKIRIDLGIPIEFSAKLMMKKGTKDTNHYCAIAAIRYSCVDAPPAATEEENEANQRLYDGTLVYIKACLNGDEPADILQYARTHSSFPHETTGDQFFTESQFESYRQLGSFAIESITGTDGVGPGDASIDEFITLAKKYLSPKKPAASDVAPAKAAVVVPPRVMPIVHA